MLGVLNYQSRLAMIKQQMNANMDIIIFLSCKQTLEKEEIDELQRRLKAHYSLAHKFQAIVEKRIKMEEDK